MVRKYTPYANPHTKVSLALQPCAYGSPSHNEAKPHDQAKLSHCHAKPVEALAGKLESYAIPKPR